MRRFFYLYPNKKGLFVVEFVNPDTGVRVCYRNTQTRNRDEALLTAARWQHDGIPKVKRGRQPVFQRQKNQTVVAVKDLSTVLKTLEILPNLDPAGAQQIAEVLRDRGLLEFPTVKAGPGQINFIEYIEKFWDYDSSSYVRDKKAHNHTIGRKYCHGNMLKVTRYWKDHFSDRVLASITRAELKKFSLELAKNGFSSSYLNGIMKAATIPLTYAYNEGVIAENPAKKFQYFSGKGKKRGVLTPQEAKKLFSIPWKDERIKIGNMVAMTTGCRIGEIQCLKKSSLDPIKPILYIRHNWSNDWKNKKDRLKATKNGSRI